MKKINILLLKKSIFTIYIFSKPSLYGLFFFATLLTTFSNVDKNSLLLISNLFVCFLLAGSVILFIVLNVKHFFDSLVKIVGHAFIDAHFPVSKNNLRGAVPMIVFWFTLLFLYIVDYSTLAWFQYQQANVIENLTDDTYKLIDQNLPKEATKLFQATLNEYKKSSEVKGWLEQLVNNDTVKKFLNYFRFDW
ncbi:MAG: hypothetical protein EOO35_00940 [Cyanobacteriota bacterium]|nr:MAG: hypothetical protein EOO35_00940 [Cyanobacteriota bacterium]